MNDPLNCHFCAASHVAMRVTTPNAKNIRSQSIENHTVLFPFILNFPLCAPLPASVHVIQFYNIRILCAHFHHISGIKMVPYTLQHNTIWMANKMKRWWRPLHHYIFLTDLDAYLLLNDLFVYYFSFWSQAKNIVFGKYILISSERIDRMVGTQFVFQCVIWPFHHFCVD